MVKFISFSSGSCGNSYYLLADGCGLLIDLGIGIRAFRKNFSNYGLPIAQINSILVTHDHTDHVRAVGAVSQKFHIPVYSSAKVHESMLANHYVSKKVPASLRHDVEKGTTFNIGPFTIRTFHVPHDSADNNGYIIDVEDLRFVLITDVGHFTEEMPEIVHSATHLVIESNFDAAMLASGRYPKRLQERISGGNGHISNALTAEFLAANLDPQRIRHVWLCHLSEENNRPALARDTVSEALEKAGLDWTSPSGFKLDVLPRRTPTLLMDLSTSTSSIP